MITAATTIITTIAGTGSSSYNGDGIAATSASLKYPMGVAVDSSRNVYVCDYENNRVRKVTASTSIITTIAGTGTAGYSGDGGQATAATIKFPRGINLDSVGNVYFGEYAGYNVIRKITVSTGIISTVAGTGSATGGYNGDNIQATAATFNYPRDVVLDSYGNLYICDSFNHRVRKVDVSTGLVSTVVGTGDASSSGDGSAATSASINQPCYSRFDSDGNLYITDYSSHRIRKVITVTTDIPTVAPSIMPTYYPSLSPHSISIITTIAGTDTAGYSGDEGPATSAVFNAPFGICTDSSGNVYVSDYANNRVRKITISTGIIATIAGTGSFSYSGDNGAASSAAIARPYGIVLDATGNLYISAQYNYRIRKVTVPTSVITTIAGTGSSGYSGDGGLATSATLNLPTGIAIDNVGNIYIAGYFNPAIRKITISTGIITTIAGSSSSGYSGDGGPATSATMNRPNGVALDSANNVYIADYNNNVIRKVSITTGTITTIAGTGTATYSGDNGPPTSAAINVPASVLVDSYGNALLQFNCNLILFA